jgi:hypothetical protein
MFHECIEDAISADVAALGGYGKVAGWLFPHLQPDQGKAHMRACLNPERAEKLAPPQVLLVMRRAAEIGSDASKRYYEQYLGCRIEFIDPKDEADELRREVRDLLKGVNQRMERIERADSRVVAIRK